MLNAFQSFPKRRSHQSQPTLYPISSSPEYPNAQNVLQFLKQSRITETTLSVEHVESLLNVLVLDGEIERVAHSHIRRESTSLNLFTSFLRSVPLSGIPGLSRTTPSLNPSVIQKINENTDPVRVPRDVRKERAQNGRKATRIQMNLLPRHEKRRLVGQNAKTAIPMTNQSENEGNPKLATTTVVKTRGNTRQRKGRSEPGQGRRDRKAEGILKTSPLPLPLTPDPNPMDPTGANSLDPSQKPRNLSNDQPPPLCSRNTITRASVPVMFTERSDQNV